MNQSDQESESSANAFMNYKLLRIASKEHSQNSDFGMKKNVQEGEEHFSLIDIIGFDKT